MKTVSPEYTASMAQPLRKRSYIRITFENIDPGAAKDGSWAAGNQMPWSRVDTLDYEYNYGPTYATLELNRWLLDGTQSILPDSVIAARNDGYIGSPMSGEDGRFSTTPMLRRDFSTPRTFAGMTFVFNTRAALLPCAIRIQYYRSGTIVKTTDVTEIPSATLTVNDPVSDIDRVDISALGCPPRSRFRLERVIFGVIRVFDNSVVSSSKQSHDVDPLTRRLPKESFSYTILDYAGAYNPDNPNSEWDFVNEKSPISVRHGYEVSPGSVEWLDPDRYILNSKPTHKNNTATFSGSGAIESMSDTYYKDTVGDKSLYNMAVAVLRDANLTPTEDGGDPWVIDDSLKSMRTVAVLPIGTHMNCLQLIAHAARCRLFTDSENIIHIEPFSIPAGDPTLTVDLSSSMENGLTFSKIDKLKAVDVKKYAYKQSNDVTTIFEETTTAVELHVEFSGAFTSVEVSVSGGSVVSSSVYGRAVDLTLSSGTKTVTITGRGYEESSVVYRKTVAQTGEVDTEENPLITNDDMCIALADHVAGYLQYRSTYDIIYRGNPELETQDVVSLQSKFTESMRGLVLTNELTFNGSLSGKLKVKVLDA